MKHQPIKTKKKKKKSKGISNPKSKLFHEPPNSLQQQNLHLLKDRKSEQKNSSKGAKK